MKEDLAPGVKPLTRAERAWCHKLDDLLREMPARLCLLEHGDQLSVIDRVAGRSSELADGAARRDGVLLADIPGGSMNVQSCSA